MTLSPEQQHALDELVSYLPEQNPVQPDWLKTWLGLSKEDVKSAVNSLLAVKSEYEGKFLDWIEASPLDATFEFIAIASWAYYQVEKGENPKVNTFIDAFYYISTCASVGYADVFATTQTGRAIASLVMIVGPSITNQALARPKRSGANDTAGQPEIS